MNRTDRLYALVEELRAVAPRPRTARHLAARFEVSVRTVERDLGALMEAGVPIYATPGRGGGYAIDPAHTLPPVNFTSDEATALAVALARPGATPLAGALRSALHKVLAAMPRAEAEAAERLAGRVHLLPHSTDIQHPPLRAVEQALVHSRVLAIDYRDRQGTATRRAVEPIALVGSGDAWYLVGHCRLRRARRAFRVDRMASAVVTDETAPERAYDPGTDIPAEVRRLSLVE
ncbi:MAG TPA: WYL domain-containing protein [Acidimicrobiales bacterium]|nr:WYL domain-containing protein [Acidimicrobiales bacterium]